MAKPLAEKPVIPVPETPEVTAPAPSVAAQAHKNIAAVKTGPDPFRPIRLSAKFISGTVIEGLNGMARYGRKGLAVGIGLGIVAAIATGGLSVLFEVTLAGLAIGMAAGGLKGALSGGFEAVGRDRRAKLYAEDLVQRKKIQDTAAPNLHDYRAAYREQQMQNSYRTQQLLERVGENTRDFNTYWQDREASRGHQLPQERGLGF